MKKILIPGMLILQILVSINAYATCDISYADVVTDRNENKDLGTLISGSGAALVGAATTSAGIDEAATVGASVAGGATTAAVSGLKANDSKRTLTLLREAQIGVGLEINQISASANVPSELVARTITRLNELNALCPGQLLSHEEVVTLVMQSLPR